MRLTARKPIEAELAEAIGREPVYKVVRVEGKKLKSLWVEGTKGHPMPLYAEGRRVEAYTLTYSKGQLSSNGKYGIWCCPTLGDARNQARGNGSGKICKIYKAYPIGEIIKTPSNWRWCSDNAVLYPSIILGNVEVETINNREA